MKELASLRVRLSDLMRLREAYDAVGKRHLVVFIDHLITEVRRDIAILERRPPGGQPSSTERSSAPQDPIGNALVMRLTSR